MTGVVRFSVVWYVGIKIRGDLICTHTDVFKEAMASALTFSYFELETNYSTQGRADFVVDFEIDI